MFPFSKTLMTKTNNVSRNFDFFEFEEYMMHLFSSLDVLNVYNSVVQ